MTLGTEKYKDSIIDTSKPNAGRMYDYILGGHHNFEVDRQATDKISKLLPFAPKSSRLQRWCLQDIAEDLTKNRGHKIIIDFASGLPTQDHIHHVVPEGTIVIYSDLDPITVQYAQKILEETKNVYYFEADATKPEDLLNRPEVSSLLGENRDVGIVCWGVSAFFPTDAVTHFVQYLYDWSSEKTTFAFQAQGAGFDQNHPDIIKMREIYKQMGSPLSFHSLEEYQELLKPWPTKLEDFISLLEWHGFEQHEMTAEDREMLGASGIGYGIYLQK